MPWKTAAAASPAESSVPYTALPAVYPQNVIVLPYYRPHRPSPTLLFLRRCSAFTAVVLLLSAALFFLYPSDPEITVVRVGLNHIQVHSSPKLTLDVSLSLTVKVRNPDFFSLDYDYLSVSIGYRGRQLGVVRSIGGTVKARGSSYVDAALNLNGLEFFLDAFYLLEDLAKGVVPFDTTTTISGDLGLLFFEIPIEGKVSCDVYLSTSNQTVVRQNCYPVVRNSDSFVPFVMSWFTS
ncbi:unnamed protein product [Linum tenue]|uniref:Water stress and hypersensitive response domain-containing protein n=2 Tax=Linum tenue TaxID=586396 RepID=A0AAV0QG77_9ROSI|nr:unnamed protein product [Linum tenue]